MPTHLYVVSRLKMIAATLQNPLFQHGLQKDNLPFPLISGFSRDVDEICALLGYYTASWGNCLPATRRRVITQKTTDFKINKDSRYF